MLSTFGAGIWFLLRGPAGYPIEWVTDIDRLKVLPSLGLVALSMVFIAHLMPLKAPAPGSPAEEPIRIGHALNAAVIAAFASSLMHNTSAPEFRPYYDNNAIIPLTFLSLFVVLDRADLRWLSAVLLVVFLGSIAGNRYYRAMTSKIPIGTSGHWAGMRLNDRGQTMASAAARARELSRPDETVLVLPEDVQMAALIARPRPALLGAIVFVDEYAPRLAEDDIRRLDEAPPKVIVIHPRQVRGWQRFYRIWSGRSGAERVLRHVLYNMIPKLYKRDSSYRTTFLWEPGTLDVYVRRSTPRVEGEALGVAGDSDEPRQEGERSPDEDTAESPQEEPESDDSQGSPEPAAGDPAP